MFAVVLIWALNFAISVFNAIGCGRTWLSTKSKGGLAHFMNWMGAIMSACGFTWCYTLLLAGLGSVIPLDKVTDAQGVETYVPFVTNDMLQAIIGLGYLVVILPILGSGLALTIQSWRYAARRGSTLGDKAIAGWNTFAQVSNFVSALDNIPSVAGAIGDFFRKGDKDKDGIVLMIVVASILGGFMTTFGIIRLTAENTLDAENERAERAAFGLKVARSASNKQPVAAPAGVRRTG